MMKRLTSAALIMVAIFSATAQAAIVTYSDRATWQAATTVTGGENFNGFVTDTSLAGGVALSSGISATGAGWTIDTPPFFNDFECSVDLTSRICGNASTVLSIAFSGGVSAYGADYSSIQDNVLRTRFELYDGMTLLTTLTPPIVMGQVDQFWGFVATAGESISNIDTLFLASDTFGVDNIEISAAGVPAPAGIAILAFGIALLRLRRS